LGGVQAGYNWHFAPQWLFGLEGDIDASGERASDGASGVLAAVNVPFNPLPGTPGSNPGCRIAGCTLTTTGNDTNSWKLQWLSTFRGRFGLTPDPSLLLYVTGGLAVAGTRFATTAGGTTATLTSNFNGQVLSAVATAGGGTTAGTDTRVGFAIGAGVEKKISQNWSVRAEYLYVDLGSRTFLAGTGFDTNMHMRDNIARAGVQYFFPK
jgi:outer membrane immunogenic protein